MVLYLRYLLFSDMVTTFLKKFLPNGNVEDEPWVEGLKAKIIPEAKSNDEHFDDDRIENVKKPVGRRGSKFFTPPYWMRPY